VAIAWIALALLPGCRGTQDMASLVDGASNARLEKIPADASVLLSLHGKNALGELPPLGEDGRELGRADRSILVEVTRSAFTALSEMDGLDRAVIWGPGEITGRLDPMLRSQLLESVSDPARRDRPIEMIATFDEGTEDLASQLKDRGVDMRTVVGNVVTLDAGPNEAFEILAMPNLTNLSQPRQMRYMDQ
jgi:hypothetical protein